MFLNIILKEWRSSVLGGTSARRKVATAD